jgi:mycothiol synthase
VREEILSVAEETAAADGVAPISEAPRLALGAGDSQWTHVIARVQDRVVGYAIADPAFGGVEGMVEPAWRRRGIGRSLAATVLDAASGDGGADPRGGRESWADSGNSTGSAAPMTHGDLSGGLVGGGAATAAGSGVQCTRLPASVPVLGDNTGIVLPAPTRALGGVRAWAHGDLPCAQGFARAVGAKRVRRLLMMGADLAAAKADGPAAEATRWRVREFVPGRDDPLWVALNAEAFAGHPEQGALSADDLGRRVNQPWYAAGDLVLAEDDAGGGGAVSAAGYVWVKIDPPGGDVGEIYAIGVHPRAQGQGLGHVLFRAGLRRLVQRGARRVVLYVEAASEPAVRLYRRHGLVEIGADAQYEVAAANEIPNAAQCGVAK